MILNVMLKSLVSRDGSFKGMKFPWECVVDICLILLLMCGSLFYLSYFFEGNQLWCVPSYGPLDSIETFEMLFVASSCKLHARISLLVYFPYFSAATVVLLLASHFFWKEIPWIQAKINLFAVLSLEVASLDQVFYERDEWHRGLLRNFSFSKQQRNRVKHIQLRMFHLLLEPSSLSKYYVFKTSFTSFLCVLFIVIISYIFRSLNFLQTTFYCKINQTNYNKYRNQFSCDLSSALPTYAIMIFHVLVYVIVFGITFKALWNHHVDPYPIKTVNCEELVAEFKLYPGFGDIMFLLALTHSNVFDGGLLLSNFLKVMLWKDEKPPKEKKYFNIADVCKPDLPPPPKRKSTSATLQGSGSENESSGSTGFISLDESFRFASATDVKGFYLAALSKYSFEGIHQPSTVVTSDESTLKRYNCWSLIHCLWLFHRQINPLIVTTDYSEFTEKLVKEVIKRKEYLLLFTNFLRTKKYKKEPYTHNQWYKVITSIDQLVQFCYYVVLAAFSNIYQASITVITLDESERNAVEILHPYTTPSGRSSETTVSNTVRHFYLARAKHLFFVFKRKSTDQDSYDTIFDKTYNYYTIDEKDEMKQIILTYKKRLKILTKNSSVKKRYLQKKMQ